MARECSPEPERDICDEKTPEGAKKEPWEEEKQRFHADTSLASRESELCELGSEK